MTRIAGLGLALFVAVGLAGCESSDGSGPVESSFLTRNASGIDAAQHSSPAVVTRTIKGTIDGSDEYGDVCGEGAGITITSTGVGEVSHFGKTVMVSTMCVNTTDYSVIGEAPYTLTAANGDVVGGFLTDVQFTSYGFDLYTSVTWGTGRFEGATGELVFPTASTGTGVWTSGVEGWIAY